VPCAGYGGSGSGQRFVVDLRARQIQLCLATLTVVVSGAGASRGVDRLAELARQTAERWRWPSGTRAGKLELRSAHGDEPRRANSASVTSCLLAEWRLPGDAPEGAHSLPQPFSSLQWLLSSEHLAYVRVLASPTEDDGDPAPGLLLCRREIWQPDGVDLEGSPSPPLARRPRQDVGCRPVDAAVPRLATLGPGAAEWCAAPAATTCGPEIAPAPSSPAAAAAPDPKRHSWSPCRAGSGRGSDRGGAAGVLAATVRESGRGAGRGGGDGGRPRAPVTGRSNSSSSGQRSTSWARPSIPRSGPPQSIDAGRLDPQALLVVGRDSRLDGAIGRLRAAVRGSSPSGRQLCLLRRVDFQLVADSTQGTSRIGQWGRATRAGAVAGSSRALDRLSAQLRERVRAELGVPAGCWLV